MPAKVPPGIATWLAVLVPEFAPVKAGVANVPIERPSVPWNGVALAAEQRPL